MLHKIIATAHVMGVTLTETARKRVADAESERGSYTVELVVVLAAIVLIAVAVTAVIRTNVLDRVNEIFNF